MGRFDDLSDYDFELLVADLLGVDLGRRFETFPRGRDGGIDLRSRMGNGVHLVQCKHYPRASVGRLVNAAAAERETLRTNKHKPRQYTFVTSRPLTRANKDQIVAELKPFVRNERDVLGGNDLEALLRKHPSVERSHVKLWLASSAPLDRIVNADVFARSEALLDEIMASMPRYVQTKSFGEARELLSDHRAVIIAGPPGVGKTTLARLLLLDAAEAGFVPYTVQSDVAEAWRLQKSEEPQVFFFDDFLGRTALFDSVREDPRDLANFILRVRRSESTRLILATREYVLQHARNTVEELQWHELDADKYSLTLERYSRLERAHIFYNHIYASRDVNAAARRSLVRDRAYIAVIDHPGYSPRLIEWMTGLGGHRLAESEQADFAAFCTSVLDHPTELWQHAFDRGLGRSAQLVLYLLATLPPDIHLDDLQRAFDDAAPVFSLSSGRRTLETALKVLQDSFVRVIRLASHRQAVSLLNPSVEDFLRARLLEAPDDLRAVLSTARYFEQVEWIQGLLVGEDSQFDERWADVLADAASRTIPQEAPGAGGFVRSALALSPVPLVQRLKTVVAWSAVASCLKSPLTPHVSALLETVEREVAEAGPEVLTFHVRLVAELRHAEFPFESLALSIQARALDAGDDIGAYDALGDLRRAVPGLFPLREWADLQDRFAAWAFDQLDDSGWFDDVDDVERFESVADGLGVRLDQQALETTREHVEEMVAEREAEALRDVEPDDDRGDDWHDSAGDETAEIDALFATLDD